MNVQKVPLWALSLFLLSWAAGCAGSTAPVTPAASGPSVQDESRARKAVAASPAPAIPHRAGFAGAFYRPQGSPPFGAFAATSPNTAPAPYPTPGSVLFGAAGYCDRVAANGKSISTGYVVDPVKLADIADLGIRWTRTAAPSFNDDLSHVFGPGSYSFADFDAAQCALERSGIVPVVGLEAGPVQYDSTPGVFSPAQQPVYQTAADFGTWCGVVAAHEKAVFPNVTRFSLPGNEVDSNPGLFPAGNAQIAAYARACYAAIKAADRNAFVYGLELNMDGGIDVPSFIRSLAADGCKAGTCYDGIAIHLSLVYPIPPPSTPCYPSAGGAYALACITAVESAANVSHVLISETVYTVPGNVPTEATKALAVTAEYAAFAANPTVDGVSYANVDECALYASGTYFSNGCLIDVNGNRLPAYNALEQLITANFL